MAYSNIDEDITSLSQLTPENLVESVSKCLQLIRPDLDVPKKLPPGSVTYCVWNLTLFIFLLTIPLFECNS